MAFSFYSSSFLSKIDNKFNYFNVKIYPHYNIAVHYNTKKIKINFTNCPNNTKLINAMQIAEKSNKPRVEKKIMKWKTAKQVGRWQRSNEACRQMKCN